jgi:hypothetical protein
MFTTPTVFVLGAGISHPFGFPSGEDIIGEICCATQESQEQMKRMLSCSVAQELRAKIDPFFHHLGRTPDLSIDRWLESSPSFVEIGKRAIAFVISNAERHAPRQPRNGRHMDWFRWLWNALRTDKASSLCQNPVWFVTFNYDRLLEYKLQAGVEDSYVDASPSEKAKAVEFLHSRIIHVHGVLSGGLKSTADFGKIATIVEMQGSNKHVADNALRITECSQGIRIVSENIEESGVLKLVHDAMKESRRIIFLGFGYERRNLERLDPLTHLPNVRIHRAAFDGIPFMASAVMGSTMGMDNAPKEVIRRQLGGLIKLDPDGLDAVGFCNRYLVP